MLRQRGFRKHSLFLCQDESLRSSKNKYGNVGADGKKIGEGGGGKRATGEGVTLARSAT